jgi:hypothetical protein
MGKTRGPYTPEYATGSCVRVASRETLEAFRREWKWHHPIQEEQLGFAGRKAIVVSVSFFHGGDELYVLEEIPGLWHEACLRVNEQAV